MDRKPYPTPPPPTPEEAAAEAALAKAAAMLAQDMDDVEIGRDRLERLAVLGMALTEAVAEYALGDAYPRPLVSVEPAPRLAPEMAARWLEGTNVPLSFSRLAASVRGIVASKNDQARARRVLTQMGMASGEHVSMTMLDRKKRVAKQLRLLLAEQIAQVAEPAEHESLLLEVDEWLVDPSVVQAMGLEPVGRIVASIIECMGYRPSLRKFTDKELGINIPWVKPERPLGAPPLPQDQLPPSKVRWTPPEGEKNGEG